MTFPDVSNRIFVFQAITRAGDAKYHCYNGNQHVIHVVGPDFRSFRLLSQKDAIEMLGRAYRNVLHEAATSRLKRLRLLPVSSGVFAGSFSQSMPIITMEVCVCCGVSESNHM